MDAELEQRLSTCRSLPSPPALAREVLRLCEQPEVDMKSLVTLVQRDPALSARLLRAANSPFYGYRRQARSLKDAVLFLGINGTISLALTFSLAVPMQQVANQSAAMKELWRRAALSASLATELGRRAGIRELEELFLCALLQDVGMLALMQIGNESYGQVLASGTPHCQLPALETAEFGASHDEVGAWLLERWRIPARITAAVAAGHHVLPWTGTLPPEHACAGLAWHLAEQLLRGGPNDHCECHLAIDAAVTFLGGDSNLLDNVLEAVQAGIPELNQLLGGDALDQASCVGMIETARELLLLRNLKLLGETEALSQRSRSLEAHARELREQAAHDDLTGLYSRSQLDDALNRLFEAARATDTPLSVIMIDLDRFKPVNDNFGHVAGDQVLRMVGDALRDSVRASDFAARYGGDEFIILLEGCPIDSALTIAKRIHKSLSEQPVTGTDFSISVTASIGVAHMDSDNHYHNAWELIHAADQALYRAKNGGRNRIATADVATD